MTMHVFAAIQQAPGSGDPEPVLRDIAPPVEVFPYLWWQVALAAVAALAVLALAVWLMARFWPRRPLPPPPTPRMIALRELERLRAQVRALDPYAFGVAVSDVLRTYVGAQFGLRAREQTSPEFLAAIRESRAFCEADRDLLARFLERSDLVKFARIGADEATSEELLGSAISFVGSDAAAARGEQQPPPLPSATG
jgi:hypothetical protein